MAQRPEWSPTPRRRRRVHRHQSAARDDRLLEGSPDLARRGIVLFRLATFLGWDAGEAEEAQRLQERAIDLLAKGGDPGTALRAATELGFLRNAAGDFAAGERQARAVVRLPRLPATASPPCTHSAFWAGHTHI
jgi:hypothetical protein